MASRLDNPAPDVMRDERRGDAVGKANPSNGQDGRPCRKSEIVANPDLVTMTQGPSARDRAEVAAAQAAKKSL